MRKSSLAVVLALSAAACSRGGSDKQGPFVAQGNGVSITAAEFKARLDEQSPFIRARYNTLERKKEFLDNLLRFEVLAKEAQRQGLDKDPDVQLTLKKVMVQKLVQKTFSDQDAAGKVPEADQKAFYAQHQDDFVRPLRLRTYLILIQAPAAGPERARKLAAARAVLARLHADEKKNPMAFVAVAREKSDDAATKPFGGDLNFKSHDELEKAWGKAAADAAFALKDGETSGVVETPRGFAFLKVQGRQEAVDRPFDTVKAQIAQRIYRERLTKEFDEYVKKLRDDAAVKVDDAELEKVAVAGAPAPLPGGPAVVPNAPAGGFHGGAPPAK